MGSKPKIQPLNLPAKLLAIRMYFNFSQQQMIEYVIPDVEDSVSARAVISDYESGKRTPSLLEILNYARTFRLLTLYKDFNVEHLINDRLELPFNFAKSVNGRGLANKHKLKLNSSVYQTNGRENSNDKESSESAPKSAEEIEIKDEIVAEQTAQNKSYPKQVTTSAPIESDDQLCRLELSKITLTRVDNLRLEMLKLMPYSWRSHLDEEKFIEIILGAVVSDYYDPEQSCPVIEIFKEMITELPEEPTKREESV